MTYRPPTKNSRREMPYLALVTQVDPDFERLKHNVIEYAFQRRIFYADPYVRGSYNNYSNVYDVGQPHGTTILPPTFDSVAFNFDRTTATFDGSTITMDSAR